MENSENVQRSFTHTMPYWCDDCKKRIGDAWNHRRRNPGHLTWKYGNKKSEMTARMKKAKKQQPIQQEEVHGTRVNRRSSKRDTPADPPLVWFLAGKIEAIIDAYAESGGISKALLASRISEFLQHKASGSGLGLTD